MQGGRTSHARLDVEVINELLSYYEVDELQQLFKAYAEEVKRMADCALRSLEKNDFLSLGRVAHTLKGTSATVGASSLVALAGRVEQAVAARSCDVAREVQAIGEEVAQFLVEAEEFLSTINQKP